MVSNLPEVGKNLFDHLLLPLYVNLEARVSVTLYKLQTIPEVLSYFVYGRGTNNNLDDDLLTPCSASSVILAFALVTFKGGTRLTV